MIEASFISLLYLMAIVIITTLVGLTLSSLLSWSNASLQAGVPVAFGVALGPFILGFTAIFIMRLLPGKSEQLHLYVIYIVLSFFAITSFFFRRPLFYFFHSTHLTKKTCFDWILIILLLGYLCALFLNTAFIPLTQNDGLEYATVGRILFDARDLSYYPVLNSMKHASGFYGPWTHPPLYPVLIYVSYILQGHAKFPGLMRFISPWFLLCATFLIYKIGCFSGRREGLLSALFFVSTPLLFLGADSALIDALPVLGMTLLIASVIGVNYLSTGFAVFTGFILGIVLWTHSEAILFIPLLLVMLYIRFGFVNFKKYILCSIIILCLSLLIAAPPYLNNMYLFGSLISDNPAVFAMPELAWKEYFQISRGIEYLPAQLQYGLFKGWFAVEAYSIIFWVMLGSTVLYFWQFRNKYLSATDQLKNKKWLLPIFGLIGTYLIGTFISMMLGIDLMIRNERYWLVLIPGVSLIAGWGTGYAIDFFKNKPPKINGCFKIIIYLLLIILFLSHLAVLSWFRLNGNNFFTMFLNRDFSQASLNKPALSVMRFLRNKTPLDASILSFKPADMYYSSRRMISYLDPKLIPFYKEKEKKKAIILLRKLGVEYIHVPDYELPPIYNSTLQTILADNSVTSLIYSADGYQIYKILTSHIERQNLKLDKGIDFSPGLFNWVKSTKFIFGGRKQISGFKYDEIKIKAHSPLSPKEQMDFFQREWATVLEIGPVLDKKTISNCIPVMSHSEYMIELNLKGHAFVSIYLNQYVKRSGKYAHHLSELQKNTIQLGEFVLGKKNSETAYLKRFKINDKTYCIGLTIEHRGSSSLSIKNATLYKISRMS